jgi:hypothetical protein
LGESIRIEAAEALEAIPSSRLQLVEGPTGFGNADNGHLKIAALGKRLKSRKYFFMRQITGCAEKYQRIGGSRLCFNFILRSFKRRVHRKSSLKPFYRTRRR